jgi:hypothetical protein
MITITWDCVKVSKDLHAMKGYVLCCLLLWFILYVFLCAMNAILQVRMHINDFLERREYMWPTFAGNGHDID